MSTNLMPAGSDAEVTVWLEVAEGARDVLALNNDSSSRATVNVEVPDASDNGILVGTLSMDSMESRTLAITGPCRYRLNRPQQPAGTVVGVDKIE